MRTRIKNPFVLALLISIAAHIIFFVFAMFARVPGMSMILNRTKHFFNIKDVKKEVKSGPVKRRGITYANNVLKFENPSGAKVVEDLNIIARNEPDKFEVSMKKKEVMNPVPILSDKEIKESESKEKVFKPLRESEVRKTRDELVGVDAPSSESGTVNPGQIIEEPGFSDEFFDKMPGFTPVTPGGIVDTIKEKIVSAVGGDTSSMIGRKTKFGDLGEYLICYLTVYKDPDDGQKYFKISIRAGKDAEKLERMPKEVLFLLDSSLSIQKDRLEEFKRGLDYALSHLNKDDFFNIIAFKENMIFLGKESLPPTKQNIAAAIDFVGKLAPSQVTDAYGALYEAIQKDAKLEASYVMFLSDGKPTYGVTNSMRIINDISKINNGRRPIFAFSGGARVNRYLLDFISYKNRGWTEYADRAHHIAKRLSQMYDKIKDPMLLNLRYRVSNVDYTNIFPKSLPDFFKNAEFVLYGKYEDENKFSMQLLGDVNDQTNEFIVLGSLKDAKEGGKDIARNWAFNKIYYLIGRLEYGKDNAKLLEEISSLCRKFDITTPYSDGIKQD